MTAFDYASFYNQQSIEKHPRLLFEMLGCRDPTPQQLLTVDSFVYDEIKGFAKFHSNDKLRQHIDKSIIQTRVFRRWAVRSRLTRLARRIPRGPVGIILGYL
jgi:hypothetical protein